MKKITFLMAFVMLFIGLKAQIFITELADPNNNASVRYIELYNSGSTDIDFTENSGWRIDKYTNASSTVSQTLNLTGIIPAGGFYIIATGTDDGDFLTVYGVSADQFDGADNDVAGSNGDDNLELYDGNNTLIDQFGVPGEDGTGTGHEFEDGRAERVASVTAGNPTWDVNEWNIDNDSGGGDGTQDAPADFDPGSWIGAPTSTPTLTWSNTTFNESSANDGSIEDTISLKLSNETFTSIGNFSDGTEYSVNNVPNGLTVVITTITSDSAIVLLSGNATAHENANDISNLEITFLNAAFDGNDASAVINSSKTDLVVDFIEEIPNLIITEIMYNSPSTDTLEFVEIYNNNGSAVNLNGYYFSGFTYTFGNITINDGEYIVVAVDSMSMLNIFGVNAYQWTSGGLSNSGETVAIYNSGAELVDEVAYDDNTAWPNADGSGHSIVLCDITADNNDATNWTISTNYISGTNDRVWASPMSADVVCTLAPSIAWSTTTFDEDAADNGSISTIVNLTLTDEEFVTVGTLISGTDFTVNNVPTGLTVEITSTSTTQATIALTGNATDHENINDIANLEITFTDNAFVSGFATNVTNYSKTDLIVDFIGGTVDPTLIWSNTTFNEASANDGSIDNTTPLSLVLSNDTFATIGTLTENTDYTVANLPNGLTVEITTTDANNATIILTGNATDHENINDVANLTITFLNVAFTGGDTSLVANYSKTDLVVDFIDAYSTNLVITEIMYNPPEGGTDTLEFVEIYNNEGSAVNLNGYYFDGFTYTFGNITLADGEYIVVTVDSMAMLNTFGINAYQWTSGGLNNSSETIGLFNPIGDVVDTVLYDDASPWPNADGSGHSIVLCDITADNNDATNWTISTNYVTMNADNERIWASPMSADIVCSLAPSIAWSTTTFDEAAANDGSISTIVDLTLTDEEFVTVGTLISGTDFTVNNVPTGLTVEITSTSTTQATITLTGNATAHSNTDDISNLEITFTDDAFVSGFATNVTNYSKTDLVVDFDDFVSTEIIENSSEISIYPNPTTGTFTVNGNKINKIVIADLTGKTIITSETNNFDLSNENNGIYFVKIYYNNSVKIKKLILNK